MHQLSAPDWVIICGVGMIWIGALITANSGLPRQLKSGPQPHAEPGSAQAFMLFWIDQYAYIGLTLCVGGVLAIIGGFVL